MAADQPVAQTSLCQLEDLRRLAVRWTLSWLAAEPLTPQTKEGQPVGNFPFHLFQPSASLALLVVWSFIAGLSEKICSRNLGGDGNVSR
jgi:hypothetical protein